MRDAQIAPALSSSCYAPDDANKRFAGNLLKVPVFLLPFSRNVHIDLDGVARIRQQLARCVAAGGCVCVARDHRSSLRLKQQARSCLQWSVMAFRAQLGCVAVTVQTVTGKRGLHCDQTDCRNVKPVRAASRPSANPPGCLAMHG
jgi:Protein of unknown function (DUF3638)